MNFPVQIIFNKANEQYLFSVPDLPGCKVVNACVDDGLAELKKAMADHLKVLVEYGERVPQAKPLAHYVNENMLGTADEKIIWALLDFNIIPYLGKSHKINVTLPELLIKQIDDRVSREENYKTRSGFIALACANELIKN